MARIKEDEERLTRLHKTAMAIKETDRVLEQKVHGFFVKFNVDVVVYAQLSSGSDNARQEYTVN